MSERSDYISLRGLAREFGCDTTAVRQFVQSHGVMPRIRQTVDSDREVTLAITREEADALRSQRFSGDPLTPVRLSAPQAPSTPAVVPTDLPRIPGKAQETTWNRGPSVAPTPPTRPQSNWSPRPITRTSETTATGAVPLEKVGVFYLIRLVPDLDPRRMKMGFAEDAEAVLDHVRMAAPAAVVIKTWVCKRSWKQAVMDCLVACAGRRISEEIFECEAPGPLIRRADAMFSLLPNPMAGRLLGDTDAPETRQRKADAF